MKRVTALMTKTADGILAILTARAHRTIMMNGLSDRSSIKELKKYRGNHKLEF